MQNFVVLPGEDWGENTLSPTKASPLSPLDDNRNQWVGHTKHMTLDMKKKTMCWREVIESAGPGGGGDSEMHPLIG